jgi:hypothetical protein
MARQRHVSASAGTATTWTVLDTPQHDRLRGLLQSAQVDEMSEAGWPSTQQLPAVDLCASRRSGRNGEEARNPA